MNSSPVVISYVTRFYWENRCLQILSNTVALNSYLGLSALSRKKILVCIKFNKGATLCQNILNALRIFARISKFRFCCFDETKQTQNDVGKFFYNFAEFVFEFFCDSRRISAIFAKFFLNSLFATWSYRYPNPKYVIQRALALPSLSHTGFLTKKGFTKYSSFSQLLSQNLAKTLLVLAPNMLFWCGD